MGRIPYKILPTLRAVVQGAYVVFFLLAGYEFHLFYARIVAGAAVTGRRPPAVEAFLPISALMSLKYFLLTGNYDEIHPAGLTILLSPLWYPLPSSPARSSARGSARSEGFPGRWSGSGRKRSGSAGRRRS